LLLYQHRILGLRVHLNPSTGMVQHRNTALIVNLHSTRVRERFLKRSVVVGDSQSALANHVRVRQQFLFAPFRELVITSEAGNEAPVLGQDLYTVVLPVGHVNFPVLVYAHTAWAIELTDTATRLSKTGKRLTLRGELLDTVLRQSAT